jgi:hypothetical protein
VQAFYEGKKNFSVKAFFAVALWDSVEDVEQCGACLSNFDPGKVPRLSGEVPSESILSRVTDVLKQVGAKASALGAATATAGESKAETSQTQSSQTKRPSPAAAKRSAPSDDAINAELEALKKKMAK